MLGPWLLLLLSCGDALLGAGLDDSPSAPPGLQRLTDSPQTAPDRGWCSTWGAGHFSTFDGHVYDFSGTCNYIFAATCEDASSTFSVQLRRGPSGNISRVIVELGASVVTVQQGVISVKDEGVVSLPYTSHGLQMTPFGQSVRLVAKRLELELVVVWGPGAYLMVLVEKKNVGRMCGLCGNFNGQRTDEFLSEDGKLLDPHKYAALQKLDDPNEICSYEAIPSPRGLQAGHAQTCSRLLTLVAPMCNVSKEPFLLSCQADMAACAQPGWYNCSCATLSEYSRQCSMAGQPVRPWRGPGLCSVGECPANQVYRECGEPCVRTCSNPQPSCSGFCTFGCFCPEGTVLDDSSKNHSCVPVPQCPCTRGGEVYAPGEATTAACQTCRCSGGRWECVEQPCPHRCALEGGSFVTTFDARPYRFHGTCTYTLLQSPQLPDGGALLAVYDKSGYSHSETSLAAVIYMSSQDKIVISRDEVITNNGDTKRLPYHTRNITVFRQTSTLIQMVSTFGLELEVQLSSVFQVYVTVGPQFRGQTRGLCGTFNGDTTDDFTTSMGIAEGTASLFVDSWRAGNCPAALERETDPCSMSHLNKVCAETHCAVLVKTGTVFEQCHATVDPKPFYKRCVYQACNYEETFPHICAALGSYALACASRGVLLQGWRSSVDNCTISCTGNQTFSYNSQACDRTCLSLSDRKVECHPSAVPVDGCNCPEGTYLNHKAECVRKAQCPCLLDDNKFLLAGQSTAVNGVICHCINGRLSCPARPLMLLATCSAPKTFQSCSQNSEDKFGAACAPTCQMLATGTPCVPTKCEPGCACPRGLYENASGQCVPPEECPCEYGGVSYPRGAELHADCKSCVCSRGTWTCQQSTRCPSTCTLYGEGHVVTFDGQRFVFDGSCEYILVTDGCGASDAQPTFKILTENVVCGNSGVTCSRAIKILSGGLSIVLADGNYTVSGEDPGVRFRVKAGSLHLELDATIGSAYNLSLIWNKHMTVFIKVAGASQDTLCGLCGNYNGNMKDDFQTRSRYVASSELEFVNSWKESPLCGDTTFTLDPCSLNTFRQSWAERKCSIINSQTFAACHSQVYHLPYYEACVRDTCGCDTGGDCECLCDAVAAYAKACVDKGVCIDWRSPDFCPIYCDFYNTHAQVGGGEYQYTQEGNCTWHYQPCLCPSWPQSLPGTNIEGCYNCSRDEYFDPDKGTCVPCAPPPTTPQPTTGSPTTATQPASASTVGLSSPSPTATPEAPTPTPSLSATPTAPSSTQPGTAPTTGTGPTISTGESSATTSAVTTRATPTRTPTATPRSTATGPTVTRATTQPTAPPVSVATQSTARSTARTTVPVSGTATGPITNSATPHWTEETPVTGKTEHTETPRPLETTTGEHTRHSTLPTTTSGTGKETSGATTYSAFTEGPHTNTQTATHPPSTTPATQTLPASTSSRVTTPPTRTPVTTTTTHLTTTNPKTLPIIESTPATASVTPTSRTVSAPTQSHPPSSTEKPTGTATPSTPVPVTGTVPTPTAPPLTTTLTLTTNTQSPASTTPIPTATVPPSPSPDHTGPTATPRTTSSPQPTTASTPTPLTHTATATVTGTHTPSTTPSTPTLPASTSSRVTAPPTGTPATTTTTHPTPSHSQTPPVTQSTPATASVTPTSRTVSAPTQSHPPSSTEKPTGTATPSTPVPITGTVPTPTAPPLTTTLTLTTNTHSTFSTTSISTSLVSLSASSPQSSTLSPLFSSPTSRFPSQSPFTTSVPGSRPPQPSSSSSPSSTLPPLHTTSPSSSLLSSHTPPSFASSSSSSSALSTSALHSPSLSTPLSTSHTVSPSTTPSAPAASTPTSSSPSPPSHPTLPTSTLPITSPLSISSTLSPVPASSTVPLSTPRTTASSPASPTASSRSTTSQSTSLTTRAPDLSLLSSTLRVTTIPISPATNFTTRRPSTTRWLTTAFLSSSVTVQPSSPVSHTGHSISSLSTSLPSSPGTGPSSRPETPVPTGTCSVKEFEEEVTYQGCTANVTMTRCEGVCASSASFNTDTLQVDTRCGCCYPVSSYEQQLVLPCADPGAQGQPLTLTLQVFLRCECSPQHCSG